MFAHLLSIEDKLLLFILHDPDSTLEVVGEIKAVTWQFAKFLHQSLFSCKQRQQWLVLKQKPIGTIVWQKFKVALRKLYSNNISMFSIYNFYFFSVRHDMVFLRFSYAQLYVSQFTPFYESQYCMSFYCSLSNYVSYFNMNLIW